MGDGGLDDMILEAMDIPYASPHDTLDDLLRDICSNLRGDIPFLYLKVGGESKDNTLMCCVSNQSGGVSPFMIQVVIRILDGVSNQFLYSEEWMKTNVRQLLAFARQTDAHATVLNDTASYRERWDDVRLWCSDTNLQRFYEEKNGDLFYFVLFQSTDGAYTLRYGGRLPVFLDIVRALLYARDDVGGLRQELQEHADALAALNAALLELDQDKF